MTQQHVGGPYFDELEIGQVFDAAPAVTLNSGLSAVHQSILGDRMRLPLDAHLSAAVTGKTEPLANPGLVCDLAIGQSTLATHHVKANLFYRGLRFHRHPHLGDTLYTSTEVVGLRDNTVKPGRKPTGLAALRITSTDQHGRTILDFYRCAMLPLSQNPDPGRVAKANDLATVGPADTSPHISPPEWNLDHFRRTAPGPHFTRDLVGTVFTSSGDVVSSAPELARLTLNIAATHHDERTAPTGRLVYGGHTIGIALAQTTRALPNVVTVLGWTSCDHLGPVSEGDTLTSELHVERADALEDGTAVHLRSLVFAHNASSDGTAVLDWRYTVLMA
ncbi:MaoC family dehydratase [Rhodococcoides fascians]|uniref:MaoC family dehydratase n=1 Tax=Rhodococcoides fascians TaxID=1828 RepID=UPI00050C8998|nr:MaoC family dehydratase [Rhodococcus fascians]